MDRGARRATEGHKEPDRGARLSLSHLTAPNRPLIGHYYYH